ncbi:MAG: GTP 3',8-cyclase MoaA [Firmicutes bacterium]|nr:GTP 3',8-cyclase MoaA [Bacillota bacterium]
MDRFGRRIDYLRISVTDRCNLRCIYCMPPEGVPAKSHSEILTLEEIARIARAAAMCGMTRIRITGGEPLVRKGLTSLIRELSAIHGIEDLALTTNGMLLPAVARGLAESGLQRVNVSLDTLKRDRFRRITRLGDVDGVLRGIDAAFEAGLRPVKLNVVAMRGWNEDEILDFARLTLERSLHVRFIELMPIGECLPWARRELVPCQEIQERLRAFDPTFAPAPAAHTARGGGPAVYYSFAGALGTVGFIAASSGHFCQSCNRLRLTADGRLGPCLFSMEGLDLRTLVRDRSVRDEDLCYAIRQAIDRKPPDRSVACALAPVGCGMSQIGG